MKRKYKTYFDDDFKKIIYACDDDSAITKAYSYYDEHGGLYELFEIDDNNEPITSSILIS